VYSASDASGALARAAANAGADAGGDGGGVDGDVGDGGAAEEELWSNASGNMAGGGEPEADAFRAGDA
jgi:hypothetical protein